MCSLCVKWGEREGCCQGRRKVSACPPALRRGKKTKGRGKDEAHESTDDGETRPRATSMLLPPSLLAFYFYFVFSHFTRLALALLACWSASPPQLSASPHRLGHPMGQAGARRARGPSNQPTVGKENGKPEKVPEGSWDCFPDSWRPRFGKPWRPLLLRPGRQSCRACQYPRCRRRSISFWPLWSRS